MKYAISHPESVDRLILSNTIPCTSGGFCLFMNEWTRRMLPFQKEIDALEQKPGFEEGDSELIEQLHRIFFRAYCFLPEKADLLNLRVPSLANIRGIKVHSILSQEIFGSAYDLSEGLKTIQAPTLIIHGDVDIVPMSTAQYVHETIPCSNYIVIPHCGHFPYVEEPEQYFKHLREFLP